MAGVLFLALAAPARASASGSIAGTVTSAATHLGVEQIEACAYEAVEFAWEAELETCDATASDGGYTILDLPPGTYKVGFIPDTGVNFVGEYFDHASSWEDATSVVVGSGEVPGIDAELLPGAAIEGTVIDDSTSLPIGEIEVCAWRGTQFQSGACAVTDENGEYAVIGLEAGTYGIEFWAYQELDYATEYYSDESSWNAADPVTVTAGGSAPGIDAAMSKGGHIEGTVTDASTGAALEDIWVCAHNEFDDEYYRCGYTDGRGHYTLRGLASSSYEVFFSYEFEAEEAEDDGYFTQYYNGKSSSGEATPVAVVAPGVTSGIDAHLISKRPPVAAGGAVLPALAPPAAPAKSAAKKHCRKGFRKKTVKGKARCVKIHRRRHHHRRHQHAAVKSQRRGALPALHLP